MNQCCKESYARGREEGRAEGAVLVVAAVEGCYHGVISGQTAKDMLAAALDAKDREAEEMVRRERERIEKIVAEIDNVASGHLKRLLHPDQEGREGKG